MKFDELLNCLMETDSNIKQLSNDLVQSQTSHDESIKEIETLQRGLSEASELITTLKRQAIAQRVIGVALCFDMQDIQYKFGGEWENDGAFDCSAYMQICFSVGTQGVVKLPRTSDQQSKVGVAVDFDKIEPGNTLHYDFNGDGKVTHVGLAMGDGLMIHTNNTELDINIIRISDYNKGKGLVAVRKHIDV